MSTPMTVEDLRTHARKLFPQAQVTRDVSGELVITIRTNFYTNPHPTRPRYDRDEWLISGDSGEPIKSLTGPVTSPKKGP